jgi:hypothetical protein
MKSGIENSELDRIIRGALTASEDWKLPDDLLGKTIRKLERRALLRRIFLELFSKIGLAILSLAVLTGVLAYFRSLDVFTGLFAYLTAHRQITVEILVMALFTLVIDQIWLRYLSLTHHDKNLAP